MEKIYVLTYHWNNEDDERFDILAASKDIRRLNAIMRGAVEQSGVLSKDMEECWDKDESIFLNYDDPEQHLVSYSFYCSPCNYVENTWEITETEVK